MLKNYLLLAVKVLARNRFYTGVSLFGISVTLMVLIVVTSIIDSFVHPQGPERNSDRILVVAGLMYFQGELGGDYRRVMGSLGYRFVENHVLPMQTPELVSVFSGSLGIPGSGAVEVTGFRDGVKITSAVKRVDANYWKVLDFAFVEGRPLSAQEHQQGAYVAVISESTRGRYFPGDEAVVGKSIDLDGSTYRVIGVVEDVSPLQTFAMADVWLPIFATASSAFRNEDLGDFMVLFKARTAADLPRIKEEYAVIMRNYRPDAQEFFGDDEFQVYSQALSKVGHFLQSLRGIQPSNDSRERADTTILVTLLSAAALVFMLLPVINLVNINISRILDRVSEIGVRKSFGATSGHLVRQFIAENLVITLIGGALGFLLAKLALALLAASGVLQGETFAFNYRIFALGLLYIAVFGLLSGVYPAWRMARLDPVRALKGAVA